MSISSTTATIFLGSLITLGLPAQASQIHPKPIKVTGCLQKGDEEKEFVITDKAGKKYELLSDSVALGEHVGHTVTVKGTPIMEAKGENEAKEEKSEKGKEASEYEGEHVQVTSLAMVSPKCQ